MSSLLQIHIKYRIEQNNRQQSQDALNKIHHPCCIRLLNRSVSVFFVRKRSILNENVKVCATCGLNTCRADELICAADRC